MNRFRQSISPVNTRVIVVYNTGNYIFNPSSNLPVWITILLRHFIEENDESERRLIELDEALAETVMRYEQQISYMQVLLANSGWRQDEEGEWVRASAEIIPARVGG